MPGLKGALGLRVSDGRTDRMVTRYCRGLKFTKTAPGGHRDMSFTMVLPRDTFTDLGPQDRTYLYDARTARTIFDGYLERPTPIDGPDGQQYDIHAMGGMALANDETRSLIYVERNLDGFEKGPDSANASQVEAGKWVGDNTTPRIRTSFPGGEVLASGGVAAGWNLALRRAEMNLGAIRVGNAVSGKTDGNYQQEFTTNLGAVLAGGMSTAGGVFQAFVTDSFAGPVDLFSLRLRRIGAATNIADETTWTDWVDISIIGQRMSRYGVLLTGVAGLISATQVLASQVVEDLLGRLLTFCDPGTAQIDATSFGITQLAYPDGVKAAGVLNDLATFHPEMVWEILETLDNGKHRFNYRAWPTTPRYEVSVKDGWRQTGSDADLCNRILVSWTDAAGKKQTTPVTASSLGLTGIGLPVDDLGSRVKDADPITLPDGKGSQANATRIGGQILTDKINPPRAGTVVVRRPITDLLTGSTVMPWELEPGYVCRVREIGEDLRVTQVDYDDDSCSSVLTLGTPVLTQEQRLARLDRVVPTIAVGA